MRVEQTRHPRKSTANEQDCVAMSPMDYCPERCVCCCLFDDSPALTWKISFCLDSARFVRAAVVPSEISVPSPFFSLQVKVSSVGSAELGAFSRVPRRPKHATDTLAHTVRQRLMQSCKRQPQHVSRFLTA